MRTLNEIIQRKRDGIDCSEDESATIKQAIKRDTNYPQEIRELFPLEYSEALSELFNEGGKYYDDIENADFVDGITQAEKEQLTRMKQPKNYERQKLMAAMFSASLPVNPIPFLQGLIDLLKEKGTDAIKSDEAKMMLWTINANAYTQLGSIDMYAEWQRLFEAQRTIDKG